jgi:hypothetical protein
MSGLTHTKLLSAYEQRIERPRFWSSFFQTPPENFHSADTVEVDIIRQGMDIGVPVPNGMSGARRIEVKKAVNKSVEPITYKYETSVNAAELTKRLPGEIPYDNPNFQAAALALAMRGVRQLETMIRDGIELDCAQVMQSGTITRVDDANKSVADYDFDPLDATGTLASLDLMVTTGTEWAAGGATGDPDADLTALATNMTYRGYTPTEAIFGTTAWTRYIQNTHVLAMLDLLNGTFSKFNPAPARDGAMHQGLIKVGNFILNAYTTGGIYKDPYAGTPATYMHAEKVVLVAPGRRDLTFGKIPRFPQAADQRALSVLPSRMSFAEQGFDIQLYAYFTPDGENLIVCGGTKALPIPTAIDSFACIDITP